MGSFGMRPQSRWKGHRSVSSIFWRKNPSEISGRFNVEPGKSTLPYNKETYLLTCENGVFSALFIIITLKKLEFLPFCSVQNDPKYIHHHLTSKSFPFLWRRMVFWRRRALDRCRLNLHFHRKKLRSALKKARLVPMYLVSISKNMGVSKNRGTPKWMVYNGKPY